MPKNLEFKARIKEPAELEKVLRSGKAEFIGVIEQKDTYFKISGGRLKIREASDRNPELIYYNRNESSSSGMESKYDVLSLKDAKMKEVLSEGLGVKVVVEKKRTLLMYRNVRIHIDDVVGLGSFIEFEVVSNGDDNGDREHLDLLKRLAAPFVLEAIAKSYSDLMEGQSDLLSLGGVRPSGPI